MTNSRQIYDLLLDKSASNTPIQEVIIGLTWTLCIAEGMGLCMSPGIPTRTLPWSGTLVNKPTSELTSWVRSWDSYQATVGMAVINAIINTESPLPKTAEPLSTTGPANLAVFEHFLPQIRGKRVAIIGRYPELSRYEKQMNLVVIERQPTGSDLPDPACEYILPESEWVFLTSTSIANKTFPRLVELSKNATLVLMGPTLPWLAELGEMGVNYLAGVRVTNPQALRQTVAEGGGTRIFETGVQYCVQKISG
ncbi:Rossmann-like domain-containing protein [Capilliphycus salinus ALCB114379]|uniref:Rossmann-like domain-containing protein n=1 Tax=Capilliphycus salinus TaxID=2768948 RepID=UPI0039A6D06E